MKSFKGGKEFLLLAVFAVGTVGIVTGNAIASENTTSGRVFSISSEVEVNKASVHLEDLVKNGEKLEENEKSFRIMDAPSVGKNVRLSIYDLASKLDKYSELKSASLRGKKWIQIVRVHNREHLQGIKEHIRESIRTHSPWKEWTTSIEFSSDDDLVLNDVGSYKELAVEPAADKERLGIVPFKVIFTKKSAKEGAEQVEKIINPSISRKVQAVIADDPLKEKDVLSQRNLGMASIWIGRNNRHKSYISSISECSGYTVKSRISTGDVLKQEDLIQPLSVKRGDKVWVSCKSGGLQVKITGTAMASARNGDYVQIRNPSSNKSFKAKVVGSKKAVINLNRSENNAGTDNPDFALRRDTR